MKLKASQQFTLQQEFAVALEKALLVFRERAVSQFKYNLETNVPRDIVAPSDVVENSLESGFVGAAASVNKWGVEPTVKLAIAILEDANCHSEAKALDAAAKLNA